MNRILIFSVAYEPYVAGAEIAVRSITDRLPAFDFDLITVRFKRTDPEFERVGRVNVYRVGFGGRLGRYLYPLFASRLARKLHRERKYRVVWAIMAAYASAAALLFLNKYKRVPFLLTLQEGDAVDYIHRKVRLFKTAWQESFKRADLIQAISNYLADWARSEGAVCPIEVVPNGVDLNKFKNQKSKSKNENSKFAIITTSRLVHKNGIDILIRAAAELKRLMPGAEFIVQIFGGGEDKGKLEKLSADLGLSQQVEFFGHVVPDQLPEHYQAADIFVRPSRSEGLGISFLEAMAAGLPVIATKVGGIPDFLEEEETGLFAKKDDPADLAKQIKRLYDDEQMRQSLGEAGRELAKRRYDWDVIAQEMGEIFRKLA